MWLRCVDGMRYLCLGNPSEAGWAWGLLGVWCPGVRLHGTVRV